MKRSIGNILILVTIVIYLTLSTVTIISYSYNSMSLIPTILVVDIASLAMLWQIWLINRHVKNSDRSEISAE